MRDVIVNRSATLSNNRTIRVTELSGGVGGARMARGLSRLGHVELTVVVNVADDERVHGLHVSPDLDTVVYTLAGVEGSEGWGRHGDSHVVNTELARFGLDNRFLLGDLDLALNLYRTKRLTEGATLSEVTTELTSSFGIGARVLPATGDPVRTMVRIDTGWIGFQDYFVLRGNRDRVLELRYSGADRAEPAPGVLDAIRDADLVVIAPSNPPLSIWPMLAMPGIRDLLEAHPAVTAISPLIGGRALKGPADRVMESLGLSPGNLGVLEAYTGLVDTLVIDHADAEDAAALGDVEVVVTDIRIAEPEGAVRLAGELVEG
ncbi:MAG: 2-phospho-L-lactate transferase [Actinobacteria bacterium]|nr:2-phospho-L-lactate transferase [Actinomycetota bacterium]